MNLLIASHYPLNASRPAGGQDKVTLRLLRGLRSYPEINPRILTLSEGLNSEQEWVRDGVPVQAINLSDPVYIPKVFSNAASLVNAIQRAKPDIVHVHTTAYAYAAVQTVYPAVMTMHSIAWREALTGRGLRKYLLAATELYVERVILNRLRHIIAIAPSLADYIRARSHAQIYPIPVAVDPEFFEIPDLDKGNRLLFVGQIYPRKGVMQLLKSVALIRRQVPEIRVDIIGDLTDSEYVAELKTYIEERQMQDHIRFLGRVDDSTLKRAYSESSLVVLSAVEEGTPACLLEAMAAGKPVVATSVGGIPSIVDDGLNGFLAPVNQVQEFAERVVLLLSNPTLRKQMGQAARIKTERHRLEFVTKQIVEVYREVIKSSQKGKH